MINQFEKKDDRFPGRLSPLSIKSESIITNNTRCYSPLINTVIMPLTSPDFFSPIRSGNTNKQKSFRKNLSTSMIHKISTTSHQRCNQNNNKTKFFNKLNDNLENSAAYCFHFDSSNESMLQPLKISQRKNAITKLQRHETDPTLKNKSIIF